MSTYILSTNMNLPVPIVGQAPGPEWADDVNNCLTLVDQHDHSNGYGVKITPSGLNINASLSFQGNNATFVRAVDFLTQAAVISDLDALYVVNGDLYYNDGAGNQIRVTQSGSIVGPSGSITGLVSPASATYVAGSQTFVWQANANLPASMDSGSIIIREIVANGKGVTIQAPTGLAANYGLTLPASLPSQQSFMTLDAAGAIAAPWTVDNSTIKIVANQLQAQVTKSYMSHSFKANGHYRVGTGVDERIFFPFAATIIAVWIFNGTTGTAGTTEFDLLSCTASGGTYASILTTTGKIVPTVAVASITRVSTTATVTLNNHGFLNGETVTISGAVQTQYNGNFVISNVTANTFDYTVAGSPATPATGTPLVSTKNNVYTDSNSVQAPQAGVTKPVVSTPAVAAGSSLRFDILQAMTGGASDCELIVQWQQA